ncbi:MAG: hypothetical protein JWO82_4259 [Akkermansiaceae bacterium]|nr:hypothetical protein [Akkermansiaceae bacterium]
MLAGRVRFLLPLLIFAAGSVQGEVDRFDRWDVNKDGRIVMEEAPPRLRAAFKEVDTDGDGAISREELRKIAPLLADSTTYDFLHDIDYVGDGLFAQRLDLLLPKEREGKKLPLIVFIHGGGWQTGVKEEGIPMLRELLVEGEYATATINYRLSEQAKWPAQILDCKAAIRFLRAKAADYGIDPDRIGVIGISAGGHLASLLGTTPGIGALDGTLGPFPQTDTRVQCVVNLFGPQDLLTINEQGASDEVMTGYRRGYERLLFGDEIENVPEAARQASPVTWVTKDDAPFLTAHGTKDLLVPFAQAEEIHAALTKVGVESCLIAIEGGGHGFTNAELSERIRLFMDKHLRGREGEISCEPIVLGH